MSIPAATKSSTSSSCFKCGIIQRSGKASCCGHGGSWFENCGSAGKTNLDHTWKEGIQVCKAREPQVVVGQQLHGSQPKGDVSPDIFSTNMDIKKAIVGAHMFASAPANLSRVSSATMHTNISVIKQNHKFASQETGTVTTTSIIPSGNILILESNLPHPNNETITKLMRSASVDIDIAAP